MATYDVKQIALPGGDIANLKDGNAIHKSNTSGFVKNDGSIDQNTYQIAQEGKGLSTNDYTDTDKSKVGKIDETTTHVSGNPISISGSKANQLAKDPIITFEPIQAGSGTPSPSNVRTISGYDKVEVLSVGANIWGGDKFVSDILTKIYGATLNTINKTIGFQGPYADNVILFDKFKPNTRYTVLYHSVNNNYADMKVVYTDNTEDVLGAQNALTAYTSTEGKSIKCIKGVFQSVGEIRYDDFGVFEGVKTISDFEPYVKTTSISESLKHPVYGGSLDVRTGVLTVDRGYISSNTIALYDSTYNICTIVTNVYNVNPDNNIAYDMISNAFQVYSAGSLYNDTSMQGIALDQNPNIWFRLTSASSQSDYETFLASHPVQICYKLATPYTIQLTPHEISLLKDYAYLSTNGTSIALDYHNGELASLADVSQLNGTLDAKFDAVEIGSNYFKFGKIVVVTFRDTVNFLSSGETLIINNLPKQKDTNVIWYQGVANYGLSEFAFLYGLSIDSITGRSKITGIVYHDGSQMSGDMTAPINIVYLAE